MTITEPTTMLTDYLLVAVCCFFGINLFRRYRLERRKALIFWVGGFSTSALAALFGGTYHGFALYLPEGTKPFLWNLTMFLIGLSALFMIAAAAKMPPMGTAAKKYLIRGLVLSMIGLAIQVSGIGIHQDMNHNDIYHLIQAAGLYLFYRGARSG
jgi:hypothetical protein